MLDVSDNFNPRTHRGVRRGQEYYSRGRMYFNPRTHRGVRLYEQIGLFMIRLYFNPRTHRGVRPMKCIHLLFHVMDFNPRTHRGVRPCREVYSPTLLYFNPRTHRGVRLCHLCFNKSHNIISIHAPIVGCDRNPELYNW